MRKNACHLSTSDRLDLLLPSVDAIKGKEKCPFVLEVAVQDKAEEAL